MSLVTNTIAGAEPDRLMLLVHGYGADERDLGGLLPYLEGSDRFAFVLPRAPLPAPGSAGYAWYDFGDPAGVEAGFREARDRLDDLLDQSCAEHQLARPESIVAGFSQGAGLALGLGLRTPTEKRPHPTAVLAMSPAIPNIDVLELDEATIGDVPVLIQHGTQDPLIPVQRVRDAARALQQRGVPIVYREYAMQHNVAIESLRDASAWLANVIAGERPNEAMGDDPVELVPSVTTASWQHEVVDSELPVIVDFWAPWCQPCRQVAPVIEAMATMRKGTYKFVKVNIDDEPQLAQTYSVQSIPLIGLFRGGRLERQSLGAKPRQQLEAELGMLVLP
jgi:thioredoxin 1